METNTTAVAQTWPMNMHRIGLVSFPSLPCHRKMSHSHTPAHYYYTYIPAAAAATEAQRAAQIKYTHTHTRRAYLSMLIRNTHRLLLFQMQREKFCIKHGHTGNFLMPRAQKRVQKSSFVRGANSQLQRGNFITQMRRVLSLSVLCFFILFHVSVAGLF